MCRSSVSLVLTTPIKWCMVLVTTWLVTWSISQTRVNGIQYRMTTGSNRPAHCLTVQSFRLKTMILIAVNPQVINRKSLRMVKSGEVWKTYPFFPLGPEMTSSPTFFPPTDLCIVDFWMLESFSTAPKVFQLFLSISSHEADLTITTFFQKLEE